MICIDTNILIWGVKGEASKGQESRVPEAIRVLKYLKKKPGPIAVPAPVLTEYLRNFADKDRVGQLAALSKSFVILPYDAKAAFETACILDSTDAAPREYSGGRRCIKFDAMILGCAIAQRCDQVLTNNAKEFRKLAVGKIVVKDLSDINVPPTPQDLDFGG